MDTGRIDDEICEIRLLTMGELKTRFIPWSLGDRGQQSFIKLKKKDEVAYLFSGVGAVLQAEVQKALMRLVNEGWVMQGEVHISFDSPTDGKSDIFLEYDNIVLELGAALLPLVDPYQGAPLLERLSLLREEIARELGFVVASVRVMDNMKLQPNQYMIRLRESPQAIGELFLDRFLALGSFEQLSMIQGWAIQEPTYRMNAKWIEVKEREKAEEAGCLVQGSLNVLLTHLGQVIKVQSARILGLQEVHELLGRISATHPVVVEEYLQDVRKLRKVRKILQNLLAEQVSIRDMISIMEIIGDNSEDMNNLWLMTEHVRRGLASQICWPHLESDGMLRVLTLESGLEKKLIASLRDTAGSPYLYLEKEDDEQLQGAIRKALGEYEMTPVILTDPALRIYLWNLLAPMVQPPTILSTAEIPPEIRIQLLGEIKLHDPGSPETPDRVTPVKKKRFWKKEKK